MRELLESVSRSSDVVVRWGGDEFLLVARELSGDGLGELAERIRSSLAQHIFDVGKGRVVRTTCSVGFACCPSFKEQLDASLGDTEQGVEDTGQGERGQRLKDPAGDGSCQRAVPVASAERPSRPVTCCPGRDSLPR
jgi:diguanylate cyclase (GGDEF)-like protein